MRVVRGIPGAVEDVATGSAAGPVAAYLAAHGLATERERIIVHHGRFVARPSRIAVNPDSRGELWGLGDRSRPSPLASSTAVPD